MYATQTSQTSFVIQSTWIQKLNKVEAMWIPPGESSMDAVKTAGCFLGREKLRLKIEGFFGESHFLRQILIFDLRLFGMT